MDEFIKLLDNELKYLTHKIIDDTVYIYIASTRQEVQCPFVDMRRPKLTVHTKEDSMICLYKKKSTNYY